MTTPATAADYTDEQLRAAWVVVKRESWPPTFEAAMEDATYSRLVRLHAWILANPSKQRHAAPPPDSRCPAAAAPTPTPRPFVLTSPPGYVDRKRAAAGDRDD